MNLKHFLFIFADKNPYHSASQKGMDVQLIGSMIHYVEKLQGEPILLSFLNFVPSKEHNTCVKQYYQAMRVNITNTTHQIRSNEIASILIY